MGAVVEYLDVEPNGLATMLGGLIEANLVAHPDREELLARDATFGIVAPDADVAASLRFSPGRVQVRNGVVGKPKVLVEASSDMLIELSDVPLKFGLPDTMTREGRAVTGKLLKRELRVKGMLMHPGMLARLNKVLSVR